VSRSSGSRQRCVVRTFRLSAKGFEKNKKIKNPQAGPTASRCHHYPTTTDLTAEEEEVALAMLDGHSHLQRHPVACRRCGARGRLVKKDATVEVSSRMSTRCHRISHQGRKVTRDLVVGGGRHRQILSSWEEAEVPPPLPVGKNRERGGGRSGHSRSGCRRYKSGGSRSRGRCRQA
jgi:hypothetical protein